MKLECHSIEKLILLARRRDTFLQMVALVLRLERYLESMCRDAGSATPCQGKGLGILGASGQESLRGLDASWGRRYLERSAGALYVN